ncbi:MAG: ATP-binding protein [Acidobacteriota bacterium]
MPRRDGVKAERTTQARVPPPRRLTRYILCVDDEQAVLNQLIHQLTRKFGRTHRIEGAESAEEALRLIEELHREGGRVELVICDQIMPGMRGDHFLEVVNRAHPDIIKILLTGHAGLDSAIYAINHAGLNKYIEKPWEIEDLNLTIQNLLIQYALGQEVRDHHRELEQKNASLHLLQDLGLRLAGLHQVDDAMPVVVEYARKLASWANVALFLSGRTRRTNVDVWSFSPEFDLDDAARRAIAAAALARCAPPHQSYLEMELPGSPPAHPGGHSAQPPPTQFALFPLRTKERTYGALICAHSHDDPIATSDAELLNILTSHVSMTVENRLLIEQRILSEKLAAIGHMVSAITHDYRTPMTVIRGYAELLEADDLPPADRRKLGSRIGAEVERMQHMIEELLDFVRGAKGEPKLAPCLLRNLFETLQSEFGADLAAGGITLEYRFADTGMVLADCDRLKRAFANLIRNSIDAMPDGGIIRVNLELDGDSYNLRIADNGVGIPKENLSRVFEPYFSSGKRHGLGLGTSIARNIIEEHGGSITAWSEPGTGTTFTILLPRAQPT